MTLIEKEKSSVKKRRLYLTTHFGDSIWRFKLEAMTILFLKLHFRFSAANVCLLYSQITVAHVTLPKAVMSMS